nr:DNA/RNA non-specific endonuclease [Phyllobacterium sp. KW56]
MPATPPDYATGFLVTSSLLVTNNHVLPDPETASRSLAEFGYELDRNFVERRGRIFPFAPIEAFYTSAELDFTVVAISPMAHDGTPITDFGVLPLIPMSGKGLAGEHVSIIQHPGGGTKQVVVRENRIIVLDEKKFPNINPAFIHYTADTELGSSGSPIFNDQWDLVAVHHLAVVDLDRYGNPLNRNDKIWTEADGEDAKKWIANEGIRISAIWAHLQRAAPFNADAARIMAMLAHEPRVTYQPHSARIDATPQKWETLPNVPEAPAFESTRFSDPAFAEFMGYKPDFLGQDLVVPLPKPKREFRGTLAINEDTGAKVFNYTHFSLAMNVERRLAAWTAVNINGKELKSAASPSWRRDSRLPANQQTLAEVYGIVPGKGIQIDRGHLVRRLDPVWGPQSVADRAGSDTFHYTNSAPQEHVYNSEVWGNLEDFVLARAEERDHKVSVMTGPILRPDDDFYGEGLMGGPWQILWSFWKIAVFKRPDDSASVTGFVIEQSRNIAPLFESTRYNPYTVDEARVFQRPISLIEDLTGLDFGDLKTMDRMGSVETTAMASARPIRGPEDIAF